MKPGTCTLPIWEPLIELWYADLKYHYKRIPAYGELLGWNMQG